MFLSPWALYGHVNVLGQGLLNAEIVASEIKNEGEKQDCNRPDADWKDIAKKIYVNAETKRKEILEDNSGKSGIYLWQNIETTKCYIGQAQNLGDPKKGRLLKYYHNSYLNDPKRGASLIRRAIIKHGHSKFIVAILEYCPIEKLDEREQVWLDKLKPEYNILKKSNSSRGYKHTLTSLAKMKGKRPGYSPNF